MSIRTRVTLYGVGIVTLAIFCLSASLFALIVYGLGPTQDVQLAAKADQAEASLRRASRADFEQSRSLTPIDPTESIDMFVEVLDSDGAVLASTGAVDGVVPAISAQLLQSARDNGHAAASVPLDGGQAGETIRVYVRPWSRPDLSMSGYIVAGQTSRRLTQDVVSLVVIFVLAGIVTFIAAAAAVWMSTSRALRPLRVMAAMADEVGQSQDLGRRLPDVSTKDAVGQLTTSFNVMMDRLAEAYAQLASALSVQQQFTADASHELRTPLTTIRNNAEFLLQHPDARADDRHAALADIVGESVRMSRLIGNLLTLARADGGVVVGKDEVNVVAVAEEVCRQARTAHPERQIHFASAPSLTVRGDEDLLRQLLWILVDNAVKFTGQDGQIWVTVTLHGTRVVLSVADDGIGIPAHAMEHIFARFYRADSARSGGGAGLGLAIAAWIVREHGGTIVASNNDRGGASLSIDIPGVVHPSSASAAAASAAVASPAVGR